VIWAESLWTPTLTVTSLRSTKEVNHLLSVNLVVIAAIRRLHSNRRGLIVIVINYFEPRFAPSKSVDRVQIIVVQGTYYIYLAQDKARLPNFTVMRGIIDALDLDHLCILGTNDG
jgi:hypothetical protein